MQKLETLLLHSYKVLLFMAGAKISTLYRRKSWKLKFHMNSSTFFKKTFLSKANAKLAKLVDSSSLFDATLAPKSGSLTPQIFSCRKGDFDINYFHLRNCIIIYEHTAAIWLLDEAFGAFFRWDNYIHTFFMLL
jgi:hypothetical protein